MRLTPCLASTIDDFYCRRATAEADMKNPGLALERSQAHMTRANVLFVAPAAQIHLPDLSPASRNK